MRDVTRLWHVTANDGATQALRLRLDTHQDTPPDVLACDHG
ncbi:hypothetical protein [Methylobacterium indicum]|nr:hypothetical protein [Methylobacterium indicum]